MSGPEPKSGVSRGAFLITIASVTGICMVAKVWIVRHGFDHPIDVNQLVIPGVIAVFAEAVDHLYRRKEETRRWRWNHPLLWGAIIVIATALSMIHYAR